MKSISTKEKSGIPVAGKRNRVSSFGHRRAESRAQQAEIHNILRSTGTQAKLIIGKPDDKYEREADRVAEQVTNMSGEEIQRQSDEKEAVRSKPLAIQRVPMVQRQEPQSDTDEQIQASAFNGTIQRQVEDEDPEVENIQLKRGSDETPSIGSETRNRIKSLEGGGRPLPQNQRVFFESRMGYDFNRVRIHTDSSAAEAAQNIRAKAFTLGSNIVFNSGQYTPENSEGKKLLAHELTHVVQQTGADLRSEREGSSRAVQRCNFDHLIQRQLTPEQIEARDRERSIIQGLLSEEGDERRREVRETLRRNIDAMARRRYEILRGRFLSRPLSPRESAQVSRVEQGIRTGIRQLGSASNLEETERQVRIDHLQLMSGLLADESFVKILARYFGLDGLIASEVGAVGDPQTEFETLDTLISENRVFRSGPQATLMVLLTNELYEYFGISRADLRVDENDESGEDDLSEQNLDRLRDDIELSQRLTENNMPLDDEEREEVSSGYSELSEEERTAFMEWMRQMQVESDEEPMSVAEMLELFQSRTPEQREVLIANQELTRDLGDDEVQPISEETVIALGEQASNANEVVNTDGRQLNQTLSQILSVTTDPQRRSEFETLDFDNHPLFNEMMMMQGLLAGAATQSAEIQEVARDLNNQIDEARERIITEIQWLMAQIGAEIALSALLTYASGGAGALVIGARAARIATWVNRLNRLRILLERAQRAYSVYQQIRSIVETALQAREAFERFRESYESTIARIDALNSRLESLEDDEDVEAELERLETQMMEQLQTQLDGQMGSVLESMYIPEDTSNEELRVILLNIPRGLTALERMMNYRDQGNPQDQNYTTILATRATVAGRLLYPLVGFLAATTSEQLQSVFPEQSLTQRLENFVTRIGNRRGRAARTRQRNRGLFARLRPNRYIYNQSDINSALERGAQWLRTRMQTDEPSGHWVPRWFRYSARQNLRELRRVARGWPRIRARSRSPRGAPEERVRIPRFRLRGFSLFSRRRVGVNLVLNPRRRLDFDKLDYRDFATAIPFNNRSQTRRRAMLNWLSSQNYEVRTYGGRQYIRLEGARRRPGFLRIDGQYIRQGIDASDHSRFINRNIRSSSDLPEGYYLATDRRNRVYVERKGRTRRFGLPRLGLSQNRRLILGRGDRIARQVAPPGIRKPTAYDQSYDWQGALGRMFTASGQPASGYNVQSKSRTQWNSVFQRNAQLRKRPTLAQGRLGYIINARSISDLLGSRHIPEMKDTDDKGHMIAKRFGGNDDYDNLVPMKSSVNRFGGRWFREEQDMADIFIGDDASDGAAVDVNIRMAYSSQSTRRPARFEIEWVEVGGRGRRGRNRRISNR